MIFIHKLGISKLKWYKRDNVFSELPFKNNTISINSIEPIIAFNNAQANHSVIFSMPPLT